MHRTISISLALLALLLPLGCKKDLIVVPPEVRVPGLVGAVIAAQDTTDARSLGVVHLTFAWETDSVSTDILYYGSSVDALPESLIAQNLNQALGTRVAHLHVAPPPPIRLDLDTNRVIFYRVRSKGAGSSGFSDVARFRTFRVPR